MPPWKEAGLFSKQISTHYNLPSKDGNNKNVIKGCTSTNSSHGKCPICDVILNAQGLCDKEFLSSISKRDKFCINAVKLVMDPSGSLYPERQRPYVYKIAWTVRKHIISEMLKPNIMNLTDPFSGFPLEVVRPKSFNGTANYTASVVAGCSRGLIPAPKELEGQLDLQQKWVEDSLKQLHDLDRIFPEMVDDKFEDLIDYADYLITYLKEQFEIEVDRSILDEYRNGDFWKSKNSSQEECQSEPQEESKEESNTSKPDATEPVDACPFPVDAGKEDSIKTSKAKTPDRKTVAPDDIIKIGNNEYLVTIVTNDIITLEQEDGSEYFTCPICLDKTWKREIFVKKHYEAAHEDGGVEHSDKSNEKKQKQVPPSKSCETSKDIGSAKTATDDSLSNNNSEFLKKLDNKIEYTDLSGVVLNIKQKCFGNFGNDEICNPKLVNICIYKDKCKECVGRS
jgi:hypothetical protein